VIERAGLPVTTGDGEVAGRGAERKTRRAAEGLLVQTGVGQDAGDDGELDRVAAMAGTDQGKVFVPEVEPGLETRRRLERLDGAPVVDRSGDGRS
jgi:hypothetical protein